MTMLHRSANEGCNNSECIVPNFLFIFWYHFCITLLKKYKKYSIILTNTNFIIREGGNLLRTVNEEARRAKTIDIMEKCYDCYAENGFSSVGIKAIADACGCSVPNLYQYFDNLDDLIVNAILFSITQGYMNTGTAKCWCTWDLPLNHWTH